MSKFSQNWGVQQSQGEERRSSLHSNDRSRSSATSATTDNKRTSRGWPPAGENKDLQAVSSGFSTWPSYAARGRNADDSSRRGRGVSGGGASATAQAGWNDQLWNRSSAVTTFGATSRWDACEGDGASGWGGASGEGGATHPTVSDVRSSPRSSALTLYSDTNDTVSNNNAGGQFDWDKEVEEVLR
jgi:hypothetical protein